MITTIDGMPTLERLVHSMLVEQSCLRPDRVLNALSVRGQELDKEIDMSIFASFDLSDTVILFEIKSRKVDAENITFVNEDDTLTIYSAMTLQCIIYGNSSYLLASILKARIESENVKSIMLGKGMNIQEVSYTDTVNEFKNETIWTRTDLNIDFHCALQTSKISTFEDFETVNDVVFEGQSKDYDII